MTNSNRFTFPKHVLYQIICTSEDITNDLVFQEKGHSYNMSFRCTIFCPTRVNIVSCIFPLVLPRPIKLSSLAPHSSATTTACWPSAPAPPPASVQTAGWWWLGRTAVKMSVFRQPQHQLLPESLTRNTSISPQDSPQQIAPFYDGRIFGRTDILIFWTDGFLDGRFQKKVFNGFLTDCPKSS